MNQERKGHWWRNRNLLWAIIVILAVWILILVSIIVDDIRGRQEIGFWEWVGVLIIPVVLAAGAAMLTNAQTQREQAVAHLQAQDEALQQYLDQVSNLLVEQKMREKPPGSDLYRLAEARTLAVLLKLDSDRKRQPLKLIARLELINMNSPLISLKNAGLNDADLHELTLLNVCLRETDLRLADLTGANLRGSDLTWTDLRGADLRRAVLTDASLAHANLLPYDRLNPALLNAPHLLNGSDPSHVDTRSNLTLAKFNDRHLTLARLDDADLQGADLRGSFLYRASLAEASLIGADLSRADLRRTVLANADLRGTVLANADLRGADLRGANLKDTDLTNANLLPYDEWDPERWSLHNLAEIDLSRERLRSNRLTLLLRSLRGLAWLLPQLTRLRATNLSESNLTGALLRNASLGGADLLNADLSGADLTGAYVTGEQLATCASLEGATMPDGTKHD